MKSKRGFTLIELLTVVAIIGILPSIIMVSLSSAQAKGRDAKRIADIRTIQLALEEYYNDYSNYPTTLATLAPAYISSVPVDPGNNASQYFYSAYNSLGNANCVTNNKPIGYHLGAGLEDGTTSALINDANAPALPTIGGFTNCSNNPGFNGKAATTKSGSVVTCTAGANLSSGVSQCYDQTN